MAPGAKHNVKWADIEVALNEVQLQMAVDKFKPATIVGVARGGLVPAVMLAERLGVHDVRSRRVQNRDVAHCDPVSSDLDQADVLFVDDIYDSGFTYGYLNLWYPRARVAMLFTKQLRISHCYVGHAVPHDKWAVFPWEPKAHQLQSSQPSEFQI